MSGPLSEWTLAYVLDVNHVLNANESRRVRVRHPWVWWKRRKKSPSGGFYIQSASHCFGTFINRGFNRYIIVGHLCARQAPWLSHHLQRETSESVAGLTLPHYVPSNMLILIRCHMMCFVVQQRLRIWAARRRELPASLLVQPLHCLQKLQPGSKLPQQHRVSTVWFVLL